ncbi:MAG: tetratricopeptide repeat protein [Pseudomonadota bacterium]
MLRYFSRALTYSILTIVGLWSSTSFGFAETGVATCGSRVSDHLVVRKAEAGDADAMVFLGKKLTRPDCTEAEQKEGVRYLALAVNAQHPDAMFTLGALLISDATAVNEEELGLAYMQSSAELGHTLAAAFLGAHLMSVSENQDQRDQAFLWLGRAANDGSVLAAMTLSQFYKSGLHGVLQDRCAAALWRETAGLLQHPEIDFSDQTDLACR